jgi:hypothetical protein
LDGTGLIQGWVYDTLAISMSVNFRNYAKMDLFPLRFQEDSLMAWTCWYYNILVILALPAE